MHRTKLALALLLGLASAPAMAQDIKVGTIFPLSGGAGPDGQTVTNAVKLMVQQINEKGGLLGRKLSVISKDDESTPAVGVSRANEMIAEKADVVIEGWNSPVTLAMQPILARGGILDITAVSKSDLILSGETNPYAIRINSSNGFDAEVIAKYVVQTMKAKKVAFLTQNDVYGNGFQTAIEAEFKKLNFSGQIVMTEKFAFKDTDFRVQLTNLNGTDADAIIVTNSSNSSGLPAMVDQYRQAGIKSTFVGAVGIMLSTVFKVAGEANNGVISADIFFPDLPPFTTQPESTSFVAAYTKAYGAAPDKSAALGAAAVQVWAQAVESTKSLDRKTVAEAIRGKSVKGTVFGDVQFLPNGQMQPRYVLFRVVDGKNAKLEALQ
ncbi:ABC transporter substrate-binding protein [Bradyrhizobium diazoefficiens]|nr:ABC transporter substrate-binding protein [Bradyrhizobium diazoefficiens]MBR0962661.1 ABC transporter substrate-binding protein [Bradyrhizobium diazoefficiens]MBR0976821.1 ABC transporter substrate-binding protein [Bradyrhizobium diazoefficiens]MBR1005466.1 ABC transporter substrate-binding protein [Bradyrhizobium diazoefficiens]MBR1011939.1 ABC transporter substrate-binding protein [Bradyrhizobium diazoefficiens]MBR1049280.1 ABC transporter substrate-binding protein [Bradyrhizobium diazoef